MATNIEDLKNYEKPKRKYTVIELFAGCGGNTIAYDKAVFETLMLNEIDKDACNTLKTNKPDWNVVEDDIHNISFKKYEGKVDVVAYSPPCQAFSTAGKQMGFADARGTLFFEAARCISECKPKICIMENVKGLKNHDNGRTLSIMLKILDEIGYNVIEHRVMKAINYRVPQKRERLFVVAIRKDLNINYEYPKPYDFTYTLKDALKKGSLYDTDCPKSIFPPYKPFKHQVMELIKPGQHWNSLPEGIGRKYCGKVWGTSGSTGMARRLDWNKPCYTLICSPSQKLTELCHPEETRPLTVREYARIQTFPDEWEFSGSMASQYKQIGNAVPVNLAEEMAFSIIKALNQLD